MWFTGQIQQALSKSKNEKIMLLTFIKGSDEDSVKMNHTLDDAAFKDELTDALVALRFDENSEGHVMFRHIYPAKSIPSIHLISSDGKEIDQLNGFVEKNELVKAINAALATQQSLKSNDNSQNSGSPAASQQSASQQLASQQSASQQVASQLAASQQSASQQSANSQPTSETGSLKRANDSPVLSQQDKEKHAQDLLKELRVKKAKEEETAALEREKDRIRTGKEIQTAKEKQQQKEMEEAIKLREREKQENKRAREAVLAQIKQDQEDRKARFGNVEVKPKPLIISQPTQITSNQTRIQFKLPDSSNLKNVFNISDPLRSVLSFIEDKTGLRSFKVETNFPKREFTDADLDKTLFDLKLVPSAVLMVRKLPEQINDFH